MKKLRDFLTCGEFDNNQGAAPVKIVPSKKKKQKNDVLKSLWEPIDLRRGPKTKVILNPRLADGNPAQQSLRTESLAKKIIRLHRARVAAKKAATDAPPIENFATEEKKLKPFREFLEARISAGEFENLKKTTLAKGRGLSVGDKRIEPEPTKEPDKPFQKPEPPAGYELETNPLNKVQSYVHPTNPDAPQKPWKTTSDKSHNPMIGGGRKKIKSAVDAATTPLKSPKPQKRTGTGKSPLSSFVSGFFKGLQHNEYQPPSSDFVENAPTMSMTGSSSIAGTGNIAAFDPLLSKKPLKRNRKPSDASIKAAPLTKNIVAASGPLEGEELVNVIRKAMPPRGSN